MTQDTFRKNYKELTENQKIDMAAIKKMGEDMLKGIENSQIHGADPRACSIAKTKLEEVVMWTVKGITK